MAEALQDLRDIAQLKYDMASAQLARHSKKIRAMEIQIAALRERLSAQPSALNTDTHQVLSSGYYDKWQRWAEKQLITQNSDLALARADKETLLADLRLAFGRTTAAQALLDKTKDEKRNRKQIRLTSDQMR